MAFDKDAFLTALDSMSVMELNELVKAIEEKFGVSAAAMAAPAAGGAAGGAAAATTFTLGFAPRKVRFVNLTDRIQDEWFEGMASASSLHTVAA